MKNKVGEFMMTQQIAHRIISENSLGVIMIEFYLEQNTLEEKLDYFCYQKQTDGIIE